MQRITPFLWFDNQAEEAANYYVSIFKDAKIVEVSRYGEAGPAPAGGVMTVSFQLAGQAFVALNGGPQFSFTEAVSFYISCATQEEVDELWAKLSDGGEEGPCGWLKDKYGVSWQVIPDALPRLMSDPNPAKAQAVTEAMFKMSKIDIAALQEAYDRA